MKRLGSQLVSLYLSFEISEMKNFSVVSQGTYWPYQLHWTSLQAVQYTRQRVASKVERTSTSPTRISSQASLKAPTELADAHRVE
jgi:hypothetical protein